MRSSPIPFAAVMLALAVLAPSTDARAELIVIDVPSDRGTEAEFQRSQHSAKDVNKALKRRKYKSALVYAENAWKTYKSPTYAQMQGYIYGKLKNDREAFRWYLTARAMDPPSAILKPINKALADHGPKAQLGIVEFKVTPRGAKVTVDETVVTGKVLGASVGEHKVVVTADGYKLSEQTVNVTATSVATVAVDLEKLAKKVIEPLPKRVELPAPSREAPSIALPLGLIIGGVVAAGAGVGLHVWGLGSASDINDQNGTWNAQGLSIEEAQVRIDDMHSDATMGSTVAYVMYGLGVGLIVTGAVIWATQGSGEGEGQADVVLTPAVVPNGGGVVLGGRF